MLRTKLGLKKLKEPKNNICKPFYIEIENYLKAKYIKVSKVKTTTSKDSSGKTLEYKITLKSEVNISDLNTDQGKIRCNERMRKKPLNKTNIRNNLSQVISDNSQIEQAMQLIMNNREIIKTHVLTKPKIKKNQKNELPINITSLN